MVTEASSGRANQKQRTRTAIVTAARTLMTSGAEVSMPAIARAALVSEATAYRYFPDLMTLMGEAIVGVWPDPAEALLPVEDSQDPVERVGYATEVLMRRVLAYQGAVRAVIAASITRPDHAAIRPGYRFGLIEQALLPVAGALAAGGPEVIEQLTRDLAIVMSAEAAFTLTDLCGLSPDEAVASAVRTARTITAAALSAARS
jgi:AcrR family transcriptional regulator